MAARTIRAATISVYCCDILELLVAYKGDSSTPSDRLLARVFGNDVNVILEAR